MASLSQLISNVKSALTPSVFAANNCFLSLLDPKDHLSYVPADKFAVVRPVKLGTRDRAFPTATAGRVNLVVSQQVEVWLYVRLALDPFPRSDSYLTDASLGALALTDSVIDALQGYTATDGANSWGYELDEITWPMPRKDENGVGWGVTRLIYHTDLTGKP